MEQGREEDPKEPMESDPDSESGENTIPKKETTLGRTQEIVPGQEDVTPPPPVSDVLGRLTTTLHQLSAVTGHRERWNRYDGSYEAQSFFTNYDAQADRAQLQYSTRLRKPPNLLQAPLRVTNTRANEKPNLNKFIMSNQKNTPKDAQVMMAILKEAGVTEYEPRVINQMLEFTYRYVTNVLDDAKVFSQHAKKKLVDGEDVTMAIQLNLESSFTSPPPREECHLSHYVGYHVWCKPPQVLLLQLLLELTRLRNTAPLPPIRPGGGPKLPSDRYCLTACNYRTKPIKMYGTWVSSRSSPGSPQAPGSSPLSSRPILGIELKKLED
ncbi:TAF9B [Cordylochernes scorpioides]|uniref:TAF9B n=1 Tax=Cordylochernes scorpioides TaxID=51811 RepID=A0ABY6LR44_9ARAC|nr:TAF9B [Cordylochernes scorpioides]